MIGKEKEILSFIKDSCGVGDNLIFVESKNGRFQSGLTENINSKYFMGNNLMEKLLIPV